MKKYIMRTKLVRYINHQEIFEKKLAIIMESVQLDDGNIIYIPSALNKMLYLKYCNKSVANTKNIGLTICEFINYISKIVITNEDELFVPLKKRGLYGLNFYHLSTFLNYSIVIKNNSYSTIKQKEHRLIEFYNFLIQEKLLDDYVRFEYKTYKDKHGRVHSEIISPFNKPEFLVSYPSRRNIKLKKLTNLEEWMLQLLLELSETHTPDITFGIVVLIMGGVRRGELVNLRIQDLILSKDKGKMTAIIKERHEELFYGRDIDLTSSCVKVPRNQVIYNMDRMLYEYFENHLVIRANLQKKHKNYISALMIDNNGQAMSGDTFAQRFSKLKSIFLKTLEETSYSSYLKISNTKWNTHICRGIFTNICIQRGYAKNVRDLANLRGDGDDDSSIVYWDNTMLAKSVAEKINELCSISEDDDD